MPLQRLSLPFTSALAALLLLVPLSAQAQTAPAGAKPTATISGRITVNEKGAPDILVAAQQLDRPFQQPAARAKSDANGRYRLTGLPAGQYQITAIAPALAPEQTGSSGPMSRMGKSLLLAPGEEADDVDIKLVQGAVITGRVTDADGKPVIEERINLQTVDQAGNVTNQGNNIPVNYQMSQTDDRGIYRIYGLSAGRYRLSVGTTEGGFMSSRNRTYYPVTFYGNTTDAAKASVVELQDGTEANNIDIRVGRAANTFVASGRVVDAENGQPIPNLRLSYGPAKVNQPFYAYYVGSAASARGEFRLEGLEPGRYGVSVAASFESSAHYADTIFFEIVDADVTNLEVKATRGQTLSGVVVFEGSRAKELQQNLGLLRVGANVTSPTNPGNSTSSSAAIAADGSFQLSGMRPGKARLYIAAMPTSPLRGITILRAERGGLDVTQNLEVQAGESITDLRIVASLGSGTVRGTVRVVGGDLPPNLRMFISMRREGAPQAGGGMVDARGRFLISSLTSGTYEVVLNMNYVPPPPGGARPIKPQTQTVTVSDGVETQVDFLVDLTPKEGGP
ncbi:MAG TPA: carboxypeptidase-like regulatory domain-containing protein [Pyrinomonadaceae bacterium]|nr:carboxypeptidase-like regulatory domain-containing protein [Pyrinomonadaceae bacterium]